MLYSITFASQAQVSAPALEALQGEPIQAEAPAASQGQPPLEQVAPPVMQGEPNLEQAGDRATVASSSQAEHICIIEAEGEDPEAVENEAAVDTPAPVRQALTPNMERALEEQLGGVHDLFTS